MRCEDVVVVDLKGQRFYAEQYTILGVSCELDLHHTFDV